MTHETAEQILVGHFDPRSNHRHSWLVAAGSNPAYEQFALQCPHPLEGWDGKLGEKICGLKKTSLLVDVLFFMAAMLVEVPTLVQRLRKEHLLVQSSADLAAFMGHQCHEPVEIVDILRGE